MVFSATVAGMTVVRLHRHALASEGGISCFHFRKGAFGLLVYIAMSLMGWA
jgi:hypothetical protein